MTTVKVQKNQIIAKQKEKVKKWYIVQEGTVIQCNSYAKIVLGKNAVIGISEGDRYLCDYVATEDSVLAVFNCESAEDLKEAIHGQESMRSILLRAALGQRQMLLRTYAGFTNLVRQFHSFAENEYSQYENLCAQYHLDEQSFTRMDNFKPLEMVHRAENWEIGNSASLTGSYLEEYVHLMQRDDNLCIGAIMEASYQTRRVTQGIIEMVEYLRYNQDILLAESKNDLFNLFFALAIQAQKKNYDVKPLLNEMDRIAEVIKKLGIYSGKLVDMRMEEYRGYHFETEGAAYETPQAQDGEEEEPQEERSEDCLVHILTYADTEQSVIEEMQKLVQKYRAELLCCGMSVHSTHLHIKNDQVTRCHSLYCKKTLFPRRNFIKGNLTLTQVASQKHFFHIENKIFIIVTNNNLIHNVLPYFFVQYSICVYLCQFL